MIVARLIQFGKLGGFHFNDSKYGDDDLDAGSIDPYRLFLVFNELVDAELRGAKGFDPAHMIDQTHNVTDPIESLMLSAIEVQRAYAQALLVDRKALDGYQDDNDALMATQTLKRAYRTDVEPILAMARLQDRRRHRSGRRLPGRRLSREGRGGASGGRRRRRRDRLTRLTSELICPGRHLRWWTRPLRRALLGESPPRSTAMHPTRRTLIAVSLSLVFAFAPLTAAFAASPQPAKGEHGMVVTAQHLASEVGVEVLKKGGNAVDAAVAVGYALAVVYPNAGNIGGGGFMTIRFKDGKIDFPRFSRARAAGRHQDHVSRQGRQAGEGCQPGRLSCRRRARFSAGFETAREKYGTLTRAGIDGAGHPLCQGWLRPRTGRCGLTSERSRAAGEGPGRGRHLPQAGRQALRRRRSSRPDRSRGVALRISEKGPDAFYKGAIADAIVKASGAKGGILAKADFEQYAVRELKPVNCNYRGYEIVSSPPPSSGGVIICEILNVLEGYPLSYLGYGSAETVHVMVEAMRHAYVDRNSALGDPDFVDNPVSKLLDKAYAREIRDKIDPFRAGVSQGSDAEGLWREHRDDALFDHRQ